MKNRKKLFITLGMLILTFAILLVLNRLLLPKFVEEIKEGSLIEEYYRISHDNEVLFVGDCEVYESFVPSYLREKFGVQSCVRGSAAQRMWQSYYLLLDTLSHEKPKVVVLSVQELIYEENAKEEYNRMTLDGMRWSKDKLAAIYASMNEEESVFEYLFPLLRYKERIFSLKEEDFRYFFKKPLLSDRGYLKREEVVPMGELPPVKPLGEYSLSEKALLYLEKITALCRKEGMELILIKAPIPYPHWYEEWEEEVVRYAKKEKLLYINFLNLNRETGIDMRYDTYDAGLHLNYSGAIKLTDYMGKLLIDRLRGK